MSTWRRTIALGAALATLACASKSDGPTSPTSASLVGTWSLQSVGGAPLPFTVSQSSGTTVELTADVLTVAAGTASGGTFTQSTTLRTTISGIASTGTVPDDGTWSLSGNTVTVHFNVNGATTTGTLSVSGSTFTILESGVPFVYTKN